MQELLDRVRAYLADLEAERHAALALSEQKAEEARLIKARQEGCQAALALLSGETSAGSAAADSEEPRRRRGRRPVRELIMRELSFSGQPMTAAQIAKAIDYIPERTETALERMENDGQVVRSEGGRWSIRLAAVSHMNGHALGESSSKLPLPA
jgi:hypothetical protein